VPHLSVLQGSLHGPYALVDVDAAVQGVNLEPPARALQRLALQLEGVVGGQEDHDGVARVGVAPVEVQDELAHQGLDARVHLGVRVLEPGADADAKLGGDLDTREGRSARFGDDEVGVKFEKSNARLRGPRLMLVQSRTKADQKQIQSKAKANAKQM
jgi:hypothetical protein